MHDTGSFFSSARRRSSGSSSRRSDSSSSSSQSDETPIRRRDTVTITTSELGKVFDAFNSISAQIKQQGEALERVKNTMQGLTAEVQELREDRKILLDKLENMQHNETGTDDRKIPPEISADIHLLHNSLSLDQQYKPDQSVLSSHNSSVRHELEEQMFQADKGYPVRIVKRAIVRYYETKRKLHLQSLPQNKERADRQKEENKLRSRRKRLFSARLKVASNREKENLEMLHYDYVSDEENGVGDNKGKWVVRCPSWRSQRATELMERLQQRINNGQQEDLRPRVARVQGAPSQRQMPRHYVAWALSQDDEAPVSENEDLHSERETGTAEGISRRRAVIYSDSESD